jgi:outer membrane protein assembly factor BamB
VTDGKLTYVYVANLGLWAFDLRGKLVWTTRLEANPIYLDFGTGSSPALAGNLLVITNDNEKQQFIAAFDTGEGRYVPARAAGPFSSLRRQDWKADLQDRH